MSLLKISVALSVLLISSTRSENNSDNKELEAQNENYLKRRFFNDVFLELEESSRFNSDTIRDENLPISAKLRRKRESNCINDGYYSDMDDVANQGSGDEPEVDANYALWNQENCELHDVLAFAGISIYGLELFGCQEAKVLTDLMLKAINLIEKVKTANDSCSLIEETCSEVVRCYIKSQTGKNLSGSTRKTLVSKLDSNSMTINGSLSPCLFIARYQKLAFFTPFDPLFSSVPFCFENSIICKEINYRWDDLNQGCRRNLIIFYVVCACLAVATTFSNFFVMVVIISNKKLLNGQAVYRMSLALSDFFTGCIIFPSYIVTSVNKDAIDVPLGDAIGFFTMLSLHVSVFTLVAAAIDRFKVVYRPLLYDLQTSAASAWKICSGLWIVSIILAALPLGVVNKQFRYKILFGSFSIPVYYEFNIGENPNLTYIYRYLICVFSIPIFMMWILTILTYGFYKKHLKKRQKITSTTAQKQATKQQDQLLFTLGIMVSVFSACTMVLVISCLLVAFEVISKSYDPTVLACAFVIFSSNSLWNFFIYSARDKTFRIRSKDIYKQISFI